MRTVLPNVVTLPQHFREHGYLAVSYGKISHNPFPDAISWDEPTHNAQDVVAHSADNRKKLDQYRSSMREKGKPEGAIERMRGPATEIQEEPDHRNYDGKQTLDAIEKMQELASDEKPFFLAVGYIRPHLPFITPKKYWDLYNRSEIPLASNGFLPKNAPTVSFGDRSFGGFYELRGYMDYADAPSPFDAPLGLEQQRELRHGYYASVSFVDAQIGLLLSALDNAGLENNTVVVLWSDHGWKLGEHGGWCKQTNYEIDTRVPLIIRSPFAKANGKTSQSLVELIDVFPTLADLAGLPIPGNLQGKSLKPILDDADAKVKDEAFSQFPRKHAGKDFMGYAMRTDQYRYVEWLDAVSGEIVEREIYDHATDPEENTNLANEPSLEAVVASLSERMWSALPKPTFPLPITQQASSLPPASSDQALSWKQHDPSSPLPDSQPKGAFQSVTFTNQRQEPVELVWLGPDGTTKVYQTIAPSGSFRIRTRPGIVWLVRSPQGESLGYFIVESKRGEQAVAEIPQ
jgi:arylsulfatase A-like enzyme